MRVLGINTIFHDPAAPVVDGRPVAAAEEERFNRRKHGKRPVPFSAWEQPVPAARERFRPVAPMVLADRAPEIFLRGPLPSPYMLFVHDVAPAWQDRIPAVVHVDGTARVQTVDPACEPLVARLLRAFERRTGLPVLVNTSLNTAGRPMVDDMRDALECFGSTPIDLLALGSFAVRR